MSIRKFVTKHIADNTDTHVGDIGDVWFDPENPVLKTASGSPGGDSIGGGGSSSPITPILQWTGNLLYPITLQTTQPVTTVVYPSNLVVQGQGCWITGFDYDEDDDTSGTGCTSLTVLNVRGVTSDIYISDCPVLTQVSAPVLEKIDSININGCPQLSQVNFPKLEILEDSFQIGESNVITGVVLPELKQAGNIRFDRCPAITSVDYTVMFPQLIDAGSVELQSMDNVTSFVVKCDSVGSFYVYNNPLLSSMVLDVIHVDYQSMSNMESMTYFRFSDRLRSWRNRFELEGALDEGSVDHILVKLAGLDGTNGTTVFNYEVRLQGMNTPPSAVGLAAVEILEGRGSSVLVNSAD